MTDELDRIAQSYIEHIRIAIEVGDKGAPFRDFLDNWYAFTVREGHLSSGKRPIWFNNPCAVRHGDSLSSMHFVSRGADEILAMRRTSRSKYKQMRTEKNSEARLMVDHAIPITVMRESLFSLEQPTSEEIGKYLKAFYCLGVLTASENARLNSQGLRSRMPPDWDGQSLFARYESVGIETCRRV